MSESSLPAHRLVEDAVRLISTSVSEFVPPEAQLHLIAAQRELLLALVAIIEHNSHRTVRSPRATRPSSASKRAARRPSRVKVD